MAAANSPTPSSVNAWSEVPSAAARSPANAAPSWSREDEYRLRDLQARVDSVKPGSGVTDALTPSERLEFEDLKRRYDAFQEEGLRAMHNVESTQEGRDRRAAAWGRDTDDPVKAVTSALTTAARGAFFFGSLISTAAPGYVGRKLGITDEGSFHHWNFITRHIILGALPVVSKVGDSGDHLRRLGEQCRARNSRVGLVVSAITRDELEGFGVGYPRFANHDDWREQLSVSEFELVEITDMTARGADESRIKEVVEHMHRTVEKGECVYVHCKAGKGRSWMVTCCYLATLGGMGFEAAVSIIRQNRHQVSPSASQIAFARQFANMFNTNRAAQQLLATPSPNAQRTSSNANANHDEWDAVTAEDCRE